jgi:four helix bundle protein
MSGGFRRLAVYEKCGGLSDELWESVRLWDAFDRWTLGTQLVRAADSVGANIAEAGGRWTYPDRRRVLFLARGSAFELEHWLTRAAARNLPCPENAVERAHELSRMLTGLAQAIGPEN